MLQEEELSGERIYTVRTTGTVRLFYKVNLTYSNGTVRRFRRHAMYFNAKSILQVNIFIPNPPSVHIATRKAFQDAGPRKEYVHLGGGARLVGGRCRWPDGVRTLAVGIPVGETATRALWRSRVIEAERATLLL